jgi:hypothetical protein
LIRNKIKDLSNTVLNFTNHNRKKKTYKHIFNQQTLRFHYGKRDFTQNKIQRNNRSYTREAGTNGADDGPPIYFELF